MAKYGKDQGIQSPRSINNRYAKGNGAPPKMAQLMDTTMMSKKNPPLPNLQKKSK